MTGKIIAVMSGKGGVGKTSVSLMVSKILSQFGRTILLDFDICGPSVTTGLGLSGTIIKTVNGFKPLNASSNLDVLSFGLILQDTDAVIWRGAKKLVFLDLFFKSAKGYEFIVIDTPPGISEEHDYLSDKNIEALIVSTPQNIALNDAQRGIEFCKAKNIPILGLIENMSFIKCKCCDKIFYPFGSKGGIQLANEYEIRYLGSLEIEIDWCESIDSGNFNLEFETFKSYHSIKNILSCLNII